MSRKSLARQAANNRAFAFSPAKPATQPTQQDRLARAIERNQFLAEQAAVLLGYESAAAMRQHQEEREREAQRLPNTAGADRSLQYLATQMLRERDGNTCYLCRKDMDGLRAVVEHIIPISRGGSNEPSNVALACTECNTKKGSLYVSLEVSSGRPCYHQPRK